MHTAEIWTVIDRKTKSRLKEARLRSRSLTKLLSRSSNLLFGFILITLAATVVHMVYREPCSTSTEAKIKAGYIITDDEVPFIAQAKSMRWVALKRSVDLKNGRKLDNYMERFGIDRKLAGLVYSISRDEGMDPELIFNICWVESQFNPDAVGSVGEIGLMQVRPETAATIDPGVTTEKLHDPAYNIRIGIKHLKDQLHFYRGDIRLALLAYNRGRNTINTLLLLGLNPANGYAAKVLDSNM